MNVRRIVLVVAAVAVALVIGLAGGRLLLETADDSGGVGKVAIGGPFSLTDQDGHRVGPQDFAGQYMLVYFGYAYCPDVCPTELQKIANALDLLGDEGQKVQPIFITIDPERDTTDVLKDYVVHFHPRLLALTGTKDEIAAAARAYRVYYAKGPVDSDGAYPMDHSSFIYLMGPDGAYVRHFGPQTTPEQMAEGIRQAF